MSDQPWRRLPTSNTNLGYSFLNEDDWEQQVLSGRSNTRPYPDSVNSSAALSQPFATLSIQPHSIPAASYHFSPIVPQSSLVQDNNLPNSNPYSDLSVDQSPYRPAYNGAQGMNMSHQEMMGSPLAGYSSSTAPHSFGNYNEALWMTMTNPDLTHALPGAASFSSTAPYPAYGPPRTATSNRAMAAASSTTSRTPTQPPPPALIAAWKRGASPPKASSARRYQPQPPPSLGLEDDWWCNFCKTYMKEGMFNAHYLKCKQRDGKASLAAPSASQTEYNTGGVSYSYGTQSLSSNRIERSSPESSFHSSTGAQSKRTAQSYGPKSKTTTATSARDRNPTPSAAGVQNKRTRTIAGRKRQHCAGCHRRHYPKDNGSNAQFCPSCVDTRPLKHRNKDQNLGEASEALTEQRADDEGRRSVDNMTQGPNYTLPNNDAQTATMYAERRRQDAEQKALLATEIEAALASLTASRQAARQAADTTSREAARKAAEKEARKKEEVERVEREAAERAFIQEDGQKWRDHVAEQRMTKLRAHLRKSEEPLGGISEKPVGGSSKKPAGRSGCYCGIPIKDKAELEWHKEVFHGSLYRDENLIKCKGRRDRCLYADDGCDSTFDRKDKSSQYAHEDKCAYRRFWSMKFSDRQDLMNLTI